MPNKSKRGHEGIEPSTSPTLKENHTTRPMAHAQVAPSSGSCFSLDTHMFRTTRYFSTSTCIAFRAPLAERSAVNRQVLGSIPSGGVTFFARFFVFRQKHFLTQRCSGCSSDAMAQWQRVGFQIRRLGVRLPLASGAQTFCFTFRMFGFASKFLRRSESSTPWRNGSASDSKSEGWGFESLWRQTLTIFVCPCGPIGQGV